MEIKNDHESLVSRIRELALHDPTIRSCVSIEVRGLRTSEDAMMMCVIELAKLNKSLQDQVLEYAQRYGTLTAS